MAVYEVKSPDGKVSLVECRTSAAAIAHVATKGYTATALRKTMDVVRRVQAGEIVETLVETVYTDAVEEPKRAPFAGRFTKKSA